MTVITTPAGKIGSRLVEELLSAGKTVRVIARDLSGQGVACHSVIGQRCTD